MKIEEFVEKFASEFDETPVELFKAETVFKELDEWGSLVALSIISMIDEEYNKRITGADIRKCETIKDLYELAENL
ncbi:phosphopantetheine-binding protein [Bacteroides oleiciplenus]|uniref:phosphopantetheine-binding protein n=1 Tax=Bacteroides oleiciplenus TaxID=626931 RepID=UPI0026DC3DA5|nr:phosphopantetheine-binding protein [Bacteroides oleiciplenus]